MNSLLASFKEFFELSLNFSNKSPSMSSRKSGWQNQRKKRSAYFGGEVIGSLVSGYSACNACMGFFAEILKPYIPTMDMVSRKIVPVAIRNMVAPMLTR